MADLTITHTHQDGTLLTGSVKGDGVYELIGPRTVCGFKFFYSIRAIGIPQSRDRLAKRWQINKAAEFLTAAGHTVKVEIDDTPRAREEVRADRDDRLDQRADRLTNAAARHAGLAEAAFGRADEISERRPMGQPILMNHHSTRSALRDQRKVEDAMQRGVYETKEAERIGRAASVVGRAAAYSDSPPVIRRRIDRLEAELRQTNHYINGTRPANDWRAAYGVDPTPATGAWLEQLTARREFLEHQIAGDREALAEHVANGYVMHDRSTVHKGDIVAWGNGPSSRARVTRVNPKSVSLARDRWPTKLDYDQVRTVHCTHGDDNTRPGYTDTPYAVPAESAPTPVTVKPEPTEIEKRAAEWTNGNRPEPVFVDARFGYFPSPPAVIDFLLAEIDELVGREVLEPSCGDGALAAALADAGATVDCFEIVPDLARLTRERGKVRTVTTADFLGVVPTPVYDVVVMNPPFGGHEISHVRHALAFVKPGGMLYAILPASVQSSVRPTADNFRKTMLARHGRFICLPEHSFKTSGTDLSTAVAVIPC